MIFNTYKGTRLYLLITFIIALLFSVACNRPKVQTKIKSVPISFKPVEGISYTEVRRQLKSGLSFDDYGFQAEPGYKITFLNNDSASVYSPDKKAFINFYVFMEQDSIFNVARSYFKMKKMNEDSLILQVLEVEGDTLHTLRSLVYMTFYSNNYLKAHNLNAEVLGRPNHRDTMFIEHKSEVANKNVDSAFSARQPVDLQSKSPLCTVVRTNPKTDGISTVDPSDYYMNPEFTITINKAYEYFSYSFAVFVDDKGKLYYDHSMIYIMPEFVVSTNKTLKAITDGYLTAYLKVTPGSTLRIRHTSYVILNVVGKK